MPLARRVATSLAGYVLVCFFLPWIQLSCVGLKERASGYDLSHESGLLWLIPFLMLLVVVLGFVRAAWSRLPFLFALSCTVGGSISAFLMYREYSTSSRTSIIGTSWTPWFWLAIVASAGVAASGLVFYTARSRSP
jgi:hypothetical protein